MSVGDPTGKMGNDGPGLAARVDAAVSELAEASQRLSMFFLAERLSRDLLDHDPLGDVAFALRYRFISDPASEDRRLYGPYGPTRTGSAETGETSRFPPDPKEVSEDIVGVWSACAIEDFHPFVRARLADLLWEAKEGSSPHRWAHMAIDCFVEATRAVWDDHFEIRAGLFRALELCRRLNLPDKEGPVLSALTEMAEVSLQQRANGPGLVAPILEVLVDREEDSVGQLTERALELYADDPSFMESLLEIAAQLRPPQDREAIWEQQVAGFVAEADKSTGMRKHALLHKASELAASKGLAGTFRDIATKLESMDADDMGFVTAQCEAEIDAETVDPWVAAIVGNDNLDLALIRFGLEIPTGDVADNRAFVEEMAQEHPLQRLIPLKVMGEFNSVLKEVADPESHQDYDMYHYEQQRILFYAHLPGLLALRGIFSRYLVSAEELAALFATPLIEVEVAERIARSIELWQQGDPDSAVSVLAPRIERIIRFACHLSGIRVTKQANAKSGATGGVLGLGSLLSSLKGMIGESERRYLLGALVEVTSLNLRNRVSHGQIGRASESDFVVLFQVACWLRLLRVSAHES